MYTQAQKQFIHKRPKNVTLYETVEFNHDDFGSIYLVANQVFTKSFTVNGVSTEFRPVNMTIPSSTDIRADSSAAGVIKFGRIGNDIRDKLKQITPSGRLKPIRAVIRVYQSGLTNPTFEKHLFVADNGISRDESSVAVQLSFDNPALITQQKYFYDPSIFVGLING